MVFASPKKKGRVFVGISGGVDSAVSTALLKKDGWDVTGVFIKIQIPGYPCPAARDRIEAMRVAAHLSVPFIEVDLSREYEREVFAPTIEEFKKGKTPNPDTLCNEKIKFGVFFDFCRSHGAEFVATGHYARVLQEDKTWGRNGLASPRALQGSERARRPEDLSEASFVALYTAVDTNKDQSYFLWGVPETVLRHTMFPIGNLYKPQVRALAEKSGLPNARRADSQGLCFLGDISLEQMLEREVAPVQGDVLSEQGEIIGAHDGIALYTLGERHGFTLFATGPDTRPHFVIAKDIKANTITVSTSKFPQGATKTIVALEDTNWIGKVRPGECSARFRYRQALIPATLSLSGTTTEVTLHEPHYVPLGQSLVLYRGDVCLGGGVIRDATIIA